jgi:DNA-binding CsgD family transcriptional regulator
VAGTEQARNEVTVLHFGFADWHATSSQVRVLAARSITALQRGDTAEALRAADAGRAIAATAPTGLSLPGRYGALAGLAELGWAECWLERYDDAEYHLRAGVTAARRLGAADLMPGMLVALAYVAAWTGRLREAVRLCRGARRHGDREVRGTANALEATVLLWIGEPDGPARCLELARAAVAEARGDDWWGRVALATIGQARLFEGNPAACVRLTLDAGRDPDLSALPASLRPMSFALLSGAALRIGDPDSAEAWVRRADAAGVDLPGQRAFAALAAGRVLMYQCHAAGAAERLRSAAIGFGRSGMRLPETLALVAGARATATAGDSRAALDMLRRAQALAIACGSRWIADLAAGPMPDARPARTARSPHRPARPAVTAVASPDRPSSQRRPADRATGGRPAGGRAAGDGWAGGRAMGAGEEFAALTERERQIAWIAGSGTKTATIARQLGVSPSTVDVHLSRIYRKLGVPGRAGLIAIVARMDPGRPGPAGAPASGVNPAGVSHGEPEGLRNLRKKLREPVREAAPSAFDHLPGGRSRR